MKFLLVHGLVWVYGIDIIRVSLQNWVVIIIFLILLQLLFSIQILKLDIFLVYQVRVCCISSREILAICVSLGLVARLRFLIKLFIIILLLVIIIIIIIIVCTTFHTISGLSNFAEGLLK